MLSPSLWRHQDVLGYTAQISHPPPCKWRSLNCQSTGTPLKPENMCESPGTVPSTGQHSINALSVLLWVSRTFKETSWKILTSTLRWRISAQRQLRPLGSQPFSSPQTVYGHKGEFQQVPWSSNTSPSRIQSSQTRILLPNLFLF